MSTQAGQAVAQAFARARDPHQAATPHAAVLNLVSRLQVILNQASGAVIRATSLPVTSSLPVYPVSGNGLGLPIAVRDADNRDLDPTSFEALHWIDPLWWREVGSSLRSWCLAGLDLLILRPALRDSVTVTVRNRALTNPLNVDADFFEIPDEDTRMVVSAAEALLLLKSRDLVAAAFTWQTFMEDLKASQTVLR